MTQPTLLDSTKPTGFECQKSSLLNTLAELITDSVYGLKLSDMDDIEREAILILSRRVLELVGRRGCSHCECHCSMCKPCRERFNEWCFHLLITHRCEEGA